MKKLFIIIFCFALYSETFGQCTNCNQLPTGTNASAIGTSTIASGHSAFASGHSSVALGDFAIAMGANVLADADYSILIGRFLTASGGQSIVLGSGKTNALRLENGISNTMMIGFNSNYPTLFVSETKSGFQSGSIGIGNITAPQAKLHIRADAVEDATLLLEAQGSKSSIFTLNGETGNIVFGGGSGNIGVARYRNPLNFYTADQQNNPQLRMTIEGENGFVGIGSDNPKAKLEIQHDSGEDALLIRRGSKNYNFRISGNNFHLRDGSSTRMIIMSNGNVGIGTSSPNALAKLHVIGNTMIEGDLYVEEVIVEDAADWPDYVFDDDYQLMSLGELKNFITENRHLPGMPKADENGNVKNLKLIQLNTQLLKKIEELTLYMLEQEERIKRLEYLIE